MIKECILFELVQAQETFSLEWVTAKGELIKAEGCRSTSFHSSGNTMKVKLSNSGLVRTVNRKTVTKFNGQEVFL